jgi:hypothetical protein
MMIFVDGFLRAIPVASFEPRSMIQHHLNLNSNPYRTQLEELTMTTYSETADKIDSDNNDVSTFGYSFFRAGSKLFITGLVLGLIPIIHYMVGGVGHKVGEKFYEEVTLWFGCPAALLVQIVQIGGLSMIAIGVGYLVLAKKTDLGVTESEQRGLRLCIVGLVAEVFTGGVLYLIFDYVFFPNFYFEPIDQGKVLWLGAQLVSFSIYLFGIILVLGGIKDKIQQARNS